MYGHHHPDHMREGRREYRQASRQGAEWARNSRTFLMSSDLFHIEKSRKRALYAVNQSAPKAEVTGSNPVGRANLLNGLASTVASDQGYLSAQCPRNVFPARSGRSALSVQNVNKTPNRPRLPEARKQPTNPARYMRPSATLSA